MKNITAKSRISWKRGWGLMLTMLMFLSLCSPVIMGGIKEVSQKEYETKWREMLQALISFCIQPTLLSEKDTDSKALTEAYERELHKYSQAIKWLDKNNPPRDQLMRHWKLVPLYEELYQAMAMITDGTKEKGEIALRTGWNWFNDTLKKLKESQNEIEQKQ